MELTRDQDIAYDKAAFFCSKSEHCSFDIQEKLKSWGLNSTDSQVVIEKLIAEKYIDDERYARAYAKDKSRFNKWGKQKIAFMLRNKKIAPEVITLALEEIEDDGYTEQLLKLLTDKAKTIKYANKFDKRNKLMRFALSRGFEADQINKALRQLEMPDEDEI
jgi:regulatory protein